MDDPAKPNEKVDELDMAATLRRLEETVSALVASVDQQHAELESLNVIVLLTAFAFGALAGIVFLQGRQIRELTSAAG